MTKKILSLLGLFALTAGFAHAGDFFFRCNVGVYEGNQTAGKVFEFSIPDGEHREIAIKEGFESGRLEVQDPGTKLSIAISDRWSGVVNIHVLPDENVSVNNGRGMLSVGQFIDRDHRTFETFSGLGYTAGQGNPDNLKMTDRSFTFTYTVSPWFSSDQDTIINCIYRDTDLLKQ